MQRVNAFQHLRVKEHTHTFVNRGGVTGELDFRFITGAPFNGLKAFFYDLAAVDSRQSDECDRPGYQPYRSWSGRL